MRTGADRCCASAEKQGAKSKAPSARAMILFFISVSLSPATRRSTLATPPFSFDDPIRPHQHIRRDRQADLLGRFEIDNELELHWLFDREIGRLGAFEDFVDVNSGATGQVV